MQWTELRDHSPHQWVVVEAVKAHSVSGRRELDELALVDVVGDGAAALRAYLRLHRQAPERELYVVHTDREALDIAERSWPGLRSA